MYENLSKYLAEHGLVIDQTKVANKTDLETKLKTALVDLLTEIGTSTDTTSATLRGILNTANATINSKPSEYIKALAKFMISNHKADIREIKLLLRELSVKDE